MIATVTGYRNTAKTAMTSYSVLDRAYCFREVATFNAGNGRPSQVCKERAELLCDTLNEADSTQRTQTDHASEKEAHG